MSVFTFISIPNLSLQLQIEKLKSCRQRRGLPPWGKRGPARLFRPSLKNNGNSRCRIHSRLSGLHKSVHTSCPMHHGDTASVGGRNHATRPKTSVFPMTEMTVRAPHPHDVSVRVPHPHDE